MLLVGLGRGQESSCALSTTHGLTSTRLVRSSQRDCSNRLITGAVATFTALGIQRRIRKGTFSAGIQHCRHVRHACPDDPSSHESSQASTKLAGEHASSASKSGSDLNGFGDRFATEEGLPWDPRTVHWSRRVVATALGALTASASAKDPREGVVEEASAKVEVVDAVERSPIDRRDYKAITLDNGLRVLLISDEDADRAAAALDVHAGYYCDPDDLPGLAHFCEHMLFLGTEEFPEENSYDAFITESGGTSNAFTDGQDTVYYFTVGAPSLSEALQRFSSFFKTPRFEQSATEREINAIDSEHAKNLQDDGFRMGQLVQTLANPQNPYHHFGTGTRATLLDEPRKRGRDIRQELLTYYDRYYVAPLMTLCIVGRQSLPELQMLTEQFFGPIRGGGGLRSPLPEPLLVPALGNTPFQKRAFALEMQVVPVQDVRNMELLFPVRFKHRKGQEARAASAGALYMDDYRRYNPAQHISSVIGYEGRKSLCASLRKQGLATALNAGNYDENEAFALFSVQVELTKEGFDRRDEVLDQIFGYINFIRSGGWPRELLQENITLSEANWRCLERAPASDTCVALARNMHKNREPNKYISSALRLSDGPGLPDAVEACLSQLTATNALLLTNSRDFDAAAKEREKWYGTKYAERDIQSLKSKWQASGLPLGLDFPAPNPFLPRSLALKAPLVGFRRQGEVDPPPETRRKDQYWQSYFRQDTEFGVPKAYAIVELLTPLPRSTAKAAVMCRLFEALLIDSLTEKLLYDAHTAGLYFNLTTSPRGVRFFFGGYDDRLLDFARVALQSTVDFDATRDRPRAAAQFDILDRELRSFSTQAPWKQANYWATLASQLPDYTIPDLIQAFETVKVEDIRAFSQTLWRESPMHGLAYSHGNLLPSEADRLVAMVSDILDFTALPESQWPKPEILKLPRSPPGSWGAVSVQPAMDPEEENSACQILYQVGSARKGSGAAGAKLCAASEVFGALIRDRFYSDLRTQQQLGYIVFSLVNRREGIITFSLTVQGTTMAPLGVVARIDDFLEAQRAYLQGLSEEAVSKVALALSEAKLARPQQLAEAVELRWREIASRDFIWDRPTREAEVLKTVRKEDVLAMYERYIADGASERRRFVSLVFGAVHRSEYSAAAANVRGSLVNEVGAFSSSLQKWA